jgi:hypothetical protein
MGLAICRSIVEALGHGVRATWNLVSIYDSRRARCDVVIKSLNRPMHLPSQLSFDLLEFRSHAITSGLPMN